MNLYIHIGAPKTGTTSLQHYLRRNQDNLARQGVLYPSGGRDKSAHKPIGAAVFPGRSDRLGGVSPHKALQTAIQSIRKEIDEQKPIPSSSRPNIYGESFRYRTYSAFSSHSTIAP